LKVWIQVLYLILFSERVAQDFFFVKKNIFFRASEEKKYFLEKKINIKNLPRIFFMLKNFSRSLKILKKCRKTSKKALKKGSFLGGFRHTKQ
jgi:hypothetical protein